MLLLTSTSDIIRVITSAASDIRVHADFADKTTGNPEVAMGRTNTAAITTATTTTVVGSPAASTARNIKALYIMNAHASATCDVTVEHFDGSVASRIAKVTLLFGESLDFIEGSGWIHLDSNGLPKLAASPRADGVGSGTDQGPGFASDTYVTGSSMNIGGRLQVGSFIRWNIRATKTAAGTATPILVIRFGTAGAVGDTARVTLTGAAQTAAADTAWFEIVAVVTTAGAAGVMRGIWAIKHDLAITGFAPTGMPVLVGTSATFDMTIANSIIGLSINGGTSAAWTLQMVVVDAVNLLP
jgi:hypothetical protein